MNAITLPPDLEQFAAEAVAAGRYRDVDDVVKAAVSLLRRADQVRADLMDSVLKAEAEGDRDGCYTAADVTRFLDARVAGRVRSGM